MNNKRSRKASILKWLLDHEPEITLAVVFTLALVLIGAIE